MKDIFIDTSIAYKFSSSEEQYKQFVRWLLTNNINEPYKNAIIVFSKKLYYEYIRSCALSNKETTIGAIVDKMIIAKTLYKNFR